MLYTIKALLKNAVILLLRLVLWPLFLIARLRPAVLRIDLPASPPLRPPGRLARWLGRHEIDQDSLRGLLERAAVDPAVRGVIVTVPILAMGRASVTEIREGLELLVHSGRTVTLVLREGGGLEELRLAPPGARIVLHPSSTLRLSGPAAAPLFLGQALQRLGIRADLMAVGSFKSAPETFTRAEISDENREQLERLLRDMDDSVVQQVARGRGVDAETVRAWKDVAVFTSEEALQRGVVDARGWEHEVVADAARSGRVVGPRGRLLGLGSRLRFVTLARPRTVGVISVRGQILSRSGPFPGAGQALADSLVPLIDAGRDDGSLDALVLEIDSRGGSATASDLVYRHVVEAAREKPVVAYLRDVAASGAYYIASGAHEIVASPDCVTGSIGVFGGKIASDGLLERLGVRMTRISVGDPGAGLMLPDRPFDEKERTLVMKQMQAVYDGFLEVVASRRGRSVDDVEPLAGGRIWFAHRAEQVGLVDVLGSWQAVRTAVSRRLSVPETRVRFVRLDRPDAVAALSGGGFPGFAGTALGRTMILIASDGVVLESPIVLE